MSRNERLGILTALLGLGLGSGLDELLDIEGPTSEGSLDRKAWEPVRTLGDMFEEIEGQAQAIEAHTELVAQGGEGCGAIPGYVHAFPALVNAAQKVMDDVCVFVVDQLPLLEKAFEEFNHVKTIATANCPLENCQDRDEARKELGWVEDKPTRH